jgi:hypothetical protein
MADSADEAAKAEKLAAAKKRVRYAYRRQPIERALTITVRRAQEEERQESQSGQRSHHHRRFRGRAKPAINPRRATGSSGGRSTFTEA